MVSAVSDDEFDKFNIDYFTEEEIRRVEAEVEARLGQPKIAIELEAETPDTKPQADSKGEGASPLPARTNGKHKHKRFPDTRSPFQKHRSYRGMLSVTDLSALGWCEVQFNYGLNQGRDRNLKSRPGSFVSEEGNTIIVAQDVAIANDKVTKQGVAVHKTLEREVKPEETKVDISTPEERWALRLVNMITSLEGIMLEGYTREFPIFGILQGQMVTGIIDELVLKDDAPISPRKRAGEPSESPGKAKKQRRRSVSPSQHLMTEYLPASTSTGPTPQLDFVAPASTSVPMEVEAEAESAEEIRRISTPDTLRPPVSTEPETSPTAIHAATYIDGVESTEIEPAEAKQPSTPSKPPPPPATSPRKLLHIVDTKTRGKNDLPTDSAALSSRMQLMIYHRLLQDMVSMSPPFDFAAFWQRVVLDPNATFSPSFIQQARLEDRGLFSLNALSEAFLGMVLDLNIVGVDTKLELVYRLRRDKANSSRRDNQSKGIEQKQDVSPVVSQEESDIARAIEASLLDGDGARASTGSTAVERQSLEADMTLQPSSDTATSSAGDEQIVTTTLETKEVSPAPLNTDATSSSHTPNDSGVETHTLAPIGIKEFEYEQETIDRYISSALQWWRGERKAEGVSEQETWKCMSCEYRDGCEWTKKKYREWQIERKKGN